MLDTQPLAARGVDTRRRASYRPARHVCPWQLPLMLLPDRLMVRQRTLTPLIEVRILVGHPVFLTETAALVSKSITLAFSDRAPPSWRAAACLVRFIPHP